MKINKTIQVSSNDIARLKSLGAAVRYFRLQANLTQKELSERSAVSEMHISHIENGERNASIVVIMRIASSVNVKPWEVFKRASRT